MPSATVREPCFGLEGKVAFITGSTRGIGLATARLMALHGATVILNGRNAETAEKCAAAIRAEFSVPCFALAFDAGSVQGIRDAYKAIFAAHRRLDIMVANAGLMQNAMLGMITDDLIRETFQVNTLSVIHHVQEASRLMARNKTGSIVTVGSIVGQTGAEGMTVYAASKSAITGLTRSAARELAPKGIRVNAVAPGMIRTDLLSVLPESKLKERLGGIPIGRFGEPEDVAKAIVFLCSDYASYITGQILGVDGCMGA